MTESVEKETIIPTISRGGSFFRTLSFAQPHLGEGYTTRYEAVEHPISNRWIVQEVWERPNVLTGDTAMIEEYEPVKGMEDLSLMEAIQNLATFEHSNLKMGLELVGSGKEELGDEHLEAFAAMNGFVMDLYNNPHLMINGRVVSRGYFAAGARDKAAALYARGPAERPAAAPTAVSHLFNASTQVDDFTRVLDRKDDYARWQDFAQSVRAVLKRLVAIQEGNFDTRQKNGLIFKSTDIRGEKEFYADIGESKSKLKDIAFISDADKDGKYNDFFEQLTLAYLVAYAKSRYMNYDSGDKRKDKRYELDEATKACEKKCRAMGGSDRDIQIMKGEIFSGTNKVRVTEYFDDAKLKSVMESVRQYSYDSIYYMPKSIVEFVADLDNVSMDLRRSIEQETRRLQSSTKGEKVSRVADKAEGGQYIMQYTAK